MDSASQDHTDAQGADPANEGSPTMLDLLDGSHAVAVDLEADQEIYCSGPLLKAVQMSQLYPDCKTFVDKKLRFPPKEVRARFERLLAEEGDHEGNLSFQKIKQFVEDNFDEEGLELEPWTPEDWTPHPSILSRVTNPRLRWLAKVLNKVWKDLSRKIADEVRESPNHYSIIYVPNGFVVPGGRFREFYYWDTYWIVKALLHCDMTSTVKGILENFLLMVDTYGMVPNGGRVYYTKRSQPPFLVLMVEEYLQRTGDNEFLVANVATLEKEMDFWESKRSLLVTKDGEDFRVFSYACDNLGPRPESYREDVEMAETFDTEEEVQEFYLHMKAGAESGWDYSTRWMIDRKRRCHGGLRSIKTGHIIPVDLNSLMFMNYRTLAGFHESLGDEDRAEVFREKAAALKAAIYNILWSVEDSMWYDYDVLNHVSHQYPVKKLANVDDLSLQLPRRHFFPSNLFPLWAECYDACDRAMVADSAVRYLKQTGAIYCKGGIPTSLMESGQQWDFPNAWPPLQHIVVAGLLKTDNAEASRMALTIARRYTRSTIFSCPDDAHEEDSSSHHTASFFEKYNANHLGSAGGGGEYEVQTGFGWSNGVVLEFMAVFGDALLQVEDGVDAEYEREEQLELETHLDSSHSTSVMLSGGAGSRKSSVCMGGNASRRESLVVAQATGEEYVDYEVRDEDEVEEGGLRMALLQRRTSCHEEDEGLVINRIRKMSAGSALGSGSSPGSSSN